MCVVVGLMSIVATGGCARAITDGVSIGLTDGLSNAVAALIDTIAASVSVGAE